MIGKIFLIIAVSIFFFSCQTKKIELKGIQYGMPQRFEHKGDTWIGTWADDGNVYSAADDCEVDKPGWSNLALFCLKGDDPLHLQLELINSMSDYGKASQLRADSMCWKASGIICIDGVLYMFVSRHDYPWRFHPADNRQTAQNGSIIKSTDHGKTWTRSEIENYEHPMFPGKRFGAAFFIEYGKNGQAGPDGSDKYVYAVSNDGYWNNGNDMVLGRVLRSKIGDLNAADWEFFKGDIKNVDDLSWTKSINDAVPVLTDSAHIGMSAVTYFPQLKKYIFAQWFFPWGGFCGRTSIWSFRQASAPWGPWEKFSCDTFPREGYYNPCILSKFIKEDALSSYITVAGDCYQQESYYKLHVIPFQLSSANSTALKPGYLKFQLLAGDSAAQIIDANLNGNNPEKLLVSAKAEWLAIDVKKEKDKCILTNNVKSETLAPGDYITTVIVSAPGSNPVNTEYIVKLKVFERMPALTDQSSESGVAWKYFGNDPKCTFPIFEKLKIDASGISKGFDLKNAKKKEFYSMQFEGMFNASMTGIYNFYLISDDGSRLLIDGKVIVDNGNCHPSNEISGLTGLEKGMHKIQVDYFQGTLNSVLQLDYEVIGKQGRRIISEEELFH